MKMISTGSSPQNDSVRSVSSRNSPASSRKSRSRKKHRRERNLDASSVHSDRSNSLTRYSVGAIFPKSWKDSFRRKRDASQDSQRRNSRSELSTEECAPGVLKVFGHSVTPGTQYKSVLATQSSTSQELIKEALERYGISRKYASNFVLCDVIGKFFDKSEESKDPNDKPKWIEECVRVVGDYEKPLTLQLYWKPVEGYSRRFEIRKRCQIQTHETDTITSGINANARRMLLAKTKPAALSTDNLYYQIQADDADTRTAVEMQSRTNIDLLSNVTHCVKTESVEEYDSKKQTETAMSFVPTDCPFLLTIKHFSGRDLLLHKLNHDEATVGNNNSSSIVLLAPDISARQCVFLKKQTNRSKVCSTFYLQPFGRGIVSVNSKRVNDQIKLDSYDVISIGEYYSFMFINPGSKPQTLNARELKANVISRCDNSSQTNGASPHDDSMNDKNKNIVRDNQDDQGETILTANLKYVDPEKSNVRKNSHGYTAENDKESNEVIQWRLRRNNEYERDSSRLKIRYQKGDIDNLLDTIIKLESVNPNMYKLCPSYLLCMCVEYSAVKFEQATTRRLLLKMVNLIQSEVWVSMKLYIQQHDISKRPKTIPFRLSDCQ